MDDMDTGDDDSGSSSDSKAIVYGTIFFGTLGLWLLGGVVVSTKGCRKFGYDHKYRYNSSHSNNNNDDNEPAEGDDPGYIQDTSHLNEPSRTTTTSATTSTISCCRFSKYGANQ
jgi:hypothetical protein